MKAKTTESFKVTPTNLRTGATAPYFVFEYQKNQNVDLKRIAQQEAKDASRLGAYETWSFEVEKI